MNILNDLEIFEKIEKSFPEQFITLKIIDSDHPLLKGDNNFTNDGSVVKFVFWQPPEEVLNIDSEYFKDITKIKNCEVINLETVEDFKTFYLEQIKPYYESIQNKTIINPFELFISKLEEIVNFKEKNIHKLGFFQKLTTSLDKIKTKIKTDFEIKLEEMQRKNNNKVRN